VRRQEQRRGWADSWLAAASLGAAFVLGGCPGPKAEQRTFVDAAAPSADAAPQADAGVADAAPPSDAMTPSIDAAASDAAVLDASMAARWPGPGGGEGGGT
jgi:hypothetical protein